MDEQNELERSVSDTIDDEPHQNARTECRKRVFLFNCDKLYSLDSVEKLLLNMKGDIRQQLSFDIVKTSFRLSEMSHVAEKAIPKLQMDVAFFVVHANETCLSINEENAGIGYAKLYKALLRATGGKVIVVIGGDDHYKNQDEEESSLISRWAKRKVSSQFTNEFLDGRKSFIFSWNKTYRKIHEEALLHYFEPSKSGQKFEWKPNDRPRVPEETLHKTPVTVKPEAKEHEQFTDDPHARDIARSSSEKEVNSDGFVVNKDHLTESEAGYYDKGDKLKEERKKGTESKDLEDHGNRVPEDCTRKIASRKATQKKDVLTSHLRDIGTINSDGYVVVNKDDLAGVSVEEQMNGRTKHGTLMMKTLVRNGSFSFRDDEMVVNPQWIPPGGFIPHITEQLQHVAEAEVIIYRMEETGALIVLTREISNLLVVYDMITYFWHMMTGMFDRVYNLFL